MAKTTPKSLSSKQRNILNFRPNIHFVEPDQIEDTKLPSTEPTLTLDQIKTDVTDLISSYKDVQDKADDIQSQLDEQAKNVVINLDPKQDSFIIQAIRRHFNDPNKTSITYDNYLFCLKEISDAGLAQATTVDPNDITSAASDPFRDTFGALGTQSGLARPELADHAQVIPPIDMDSFVVQQLEVLLEKLTPGITGIATKVATKIVKDIL